MPLEDSERDSSVALPWCLLPLEGTSRSLRIHSALPLRRYTTILPECWGVCFLFPGRAAKMQMLQSVQATSYTEINRACLQSRRHPLPPPPIQSHPWASMQLQRQKGWPHPPLALLRWLQLLTVAPAYAFCVPSPQHGFWQCALVAWQTWVLEVLHRPP